MACDYSGYCIGADCPMFFTCQVDTENTAVTENTENATDWAYVYDESDNKAKEDYIWQCMCDGFITTEEAKQALENTDNNKIQEKEGDI